MNAILVFMFSCFIVLFAKTSSQLQYSIAKLNSESPIHNWMVPDIIFQSSFRSKIECLVACAEHHDYLSFSYNKYFHVCAAYNVVFNSTYMEVDNGWKYYIIHGCRQNWIRFAGACYYFSENGNRTWQEAKDFCEGIGSILVEIYDLEEQNFIESRCALLKGYWTGGTDLNKENIWRWNDSYLSIQLPSESGFQGWAQNQPNNINGQQHCLLLQHRYEYKWSDNDCTDRSDFICEKNMYDHNNK